MKINTLTKPSNISFEEDIHQVDFKISKKEKTEKELEEKLKTEIKNRNGNCLKWEGSPGAPDRIVFLNKKIYFIEIKLFGKKLSPKQKIFHSWMKSSGYYVKIIDNEKILKDFLEEIDGENSQNK